MKEKLLMKKCLPVGKALLVFAISLLFSGCLKDKITKSYTLMRPLYASKASVLENISSNQPRALEAPGKIFILGRYIFVNEIDKGVHVIDNLDPAKPNPVAFINIPGNIDIAVKGTTLFADMYTDLLTVDISDPLNARLLASVPGVFPTRNYGNMLNDTSFIIVDWETKDTMVNAEQASGFAVDFVLAPFAEMSDGSKNNYVPGIAGSMARFSIVNDYLYAVDLAALHTFDISNTHEPKQRNTTQLGWLIETIYPFEGKLFIGSSTGMFIYEINDPANPTPAGSFSHARACDPVVADGNYAYVTLRTGNICAGTNNQLDIIDISNINEPRLLKTYEMKNPAGLTKDGNTLFICDGSAGLKVYDASNVNDLKLVSRISDIETFDAIAWNKVLLVVGSKGLYQYDYSNIGNLRELSVIPTRN